MTTTEDAPPQNGRLANGRFAKGHKGGPGNRSARIDVPKLMRRYCEERGMDVEALLAEVALAMLYNGACGDVAAARLAYEMLGKQEPKGPQVAIGIGASAPQLPPLEGNQDTPALSEHLVKLQRIAEERGLTDLVAKHPRDVAITVAERVQERDEIAELLG